VTGLLQIGVVSVPFARRVFGESGHSAWEWATIAVLALVPVTLIEITKLVRSRLVGSNAARA
jgi:hypothetical protein